MDNPLMIRYPTFSTRDYWGAAFLLLQGVRLLRTSVLDTGKVEFEFDNDLDDRAHKAFVDFRSSNGEDMVPLKAYREAYRRIQDEARKARGDGYSYGYQGYHGD